MNRIFHARIAWYQYVYLIVLGGLTFILLWGKSILPAVFCAILLVLLIERFIHTTYTITTDGKLILFAGRFSKPRIIQLKDIIWVEKRTTVKLGKFYIADYLLIHYEKKKYVTVLPLKEREFMDILERTQIKNLNENKERI